MTIKVFIWLDLHGRSILGLKQNKLHYFMLYNFMLFRVNIQHRWYQGMEAVKQYIFFYLTR